MDFLFVRRLRNGVRMNMTGDTAPIGIWRQLRFWWRTPSGIDLYVAVIDGHRAGYLLLRKGGATTYITEAVDAAYRGRGIAKTMIRHAQGLCDDLTAEILLTNAASLRLHEAAGFVRAGDDGRVAVYRLGPGRARLP